MFSANMTPFEDFSFAHKLGAILNLDDISDIDYFQHLPHIPELVSCRYNPGGKFAISNEIMNTPAEAKYGFTREQLTTGYRRLMDLGVRKFGLHAFLASNTRNNDYYPVLARLLFQTAVSSTKRPGRDQRSIFREVSVSLTIPTISPPTLQRSVKVYARRMPISWCRRYGGRGGCHGARPLHARPVRVPGGHCHSQEGDLQELHRA